MQKKIMIAILGGVALGMSSSPRQYSNTFRKLQGDWKNVNPYNVKRSIGRLSKEKLLEEKKLPDGSFKLVLTSKGEKEAKKLSLMGSSINFKKPKKWDGNWRIILFDIPEKDREFRDILRNHLRDLDFKKLQHSVFISPYPFEKAISELTRLYSAEKYVRIITATRIDNEDKMKRYFFKKK